MTNKTNNTIYFYVFVRVVPHRESELQQALQLILPDRVTRLAIAEHDLLQLQIQLEEVQKENTMIKRTNTQLTENLEDPKTRLAEIQLRMESSRANDSSIMPGGETAQKKLRGWKLNWRNSKT